MYYISVAEVIKTTEAERLELGTKEEDLNIKTDADQLISIS